MYINDNWVLESGNYIFEICKNVNEVILSEDVYIECEDDIIENELYNKLYKKNVDKISDSDFEKLIGRKLIKKVSKNLIYEDKKNVQDLLLDKVMNSSNVPKINYLGTFF